MPFTSKFPDLIPHCPWESQIPRAAGHEGSGVPCAPAGLVGPSGPFLFSSPGLKPGQNSRFQGMKRCQSQLPVSKAKQQTTRCPDHQPPAFAWPALVRRPHRPPLRTPSRPTPLVGPPLLRTGRPPCLTSSWVEASASPLSVSLTRTEDFHLTWLHPQNNSTAIWVIREKGREHGKSVTAAGQVCAQRAGRAVRP